jgi:energy-coupling factor transporter ATP-binding protein EcfA2
VSNKEIIVRHLNFTYLKAPQPVLQDIHFEIEAGTVTAIVGQVGAGKSTLLKMLNGLIPSIIPGQVEGDIIVAGQEVRGKDPAFMAQFINLVFDDPVLQIVQLTAEEDVAFGPANLNLPREEVWKRVFWALERVDLKGFEKRNPRSMSGGEQQLLALAGILAMRPRIIGLDEPIAMLDPLGKARVLQAIREMKESQGATILIAESGTDIEAICEFADHMILMDKGRILDRGKPGELFARRQIVEESKLKVPQVTRVAWNLIPSIVSPEVPVTLEGGRRWLSSLLETPQSKPAIQAPPPVRETPVISATRPEEEPAIEIKNLHHVFPGDPPVHALKGINLTFAKGDFVALLGQNGSGKTTLAFHLVGAEKPTNKDASIRVNGVDVLKSPLSQVVRQINYLFQNPANQLFCQTFGQEVTFGPQALGSGPGEAAERGREALRKVGLEHLWDYYTLSVVKSLETLLSLASLLAMNPRILIADEPTGGLDFATGEKVMEILLDLNRQGRTIIVITHDMELAAKYCRRLVVLRRGEVWMDGTPKEVFGQPERLTQTRLSPPQVTLLAQSLASYGFPQDVMSTEEFVSLAQSSLQTRP